MKVTELISRLQVFEEEHGNLDVQSPLGEHFDHDPIKSVRYVEEEKYWDGSHWQMGDYCLLSDV